MTEDDFQELLRYQNLLSRQVLQEAKTDRTIKVLDIFNELSLSSKRRLQTATLLHEAQQRGMSEQDVYLVLDDLIRNGVIEEKDGYVRKL